ncbi:MAG: hypothetical protein AAGD14_12325 [Planctomycetota bacterium]
MDFWAQHKDFILRVLAGLGVFVVALIARGIVHGDDLQTSRVANKRAVSQIKREKVAPRGTVSELRNAAEDLQSNVSLIANEIGFDAGDERKLQRELLRRIFERIIRVRELDGDSAEVRAERVQNAMAININGAFGALRLLMRDEILDEAAERNVAVPEDGMGFANLVSIEAGDLTKYLLQLELVTRVVTDALGMEMTTASGRKRQVRVAAIEEVRIDSDQTTASPIPGANPQYLREYKVRIRVRGGEAAIVELFNRLESESPRVAIRGLKAERRPRDMIDLELELLAIAVDPSVDFTVTEEEQQ